MNNRLGINLCNWTEQLSEDCLPLLQRAAALGFTAVELPMSNPRPACAEELRRESGRLGLELTLCAWLGKGLDISSFDPAERAASKTYLTACIETAHQLGAVMLAGPLYAGGGKRHVLSPMEETREWTLAVDGLKEMGEIAAEHGVTLAIEPLHRYRTSVVNTMAQAARMAGEIGGGVKVLFDTFHANMEEDNIPQALEELLQADLLGHFHACGNHRGAPGTGHIPWELLFTLLKDYGYTGHITMETFAPGGFDSGFVLSGMTPDETAAAGIRFLRRWFSCGGM